MLPYDQIPPEHLATGEAFSRLDEHGALLMLAIAQWMARDDTRPHAAERRAASTAMAEIDAMLAGLHQLRARLVSEIRADDDAAIRRADEILRRRPGGDAGPGRPGRVGLPVTRPPPES